MLLLSFFARVNSFFHLCSDALIIEPIAPLAPIGTPVSFRSAAAALPPSATPSAILLPEVSRVVREHDIPEMPAPEKDDAAIPERKELAPEPQRQTKGPPRH